MKTVRRFKLRNFAAALLFAGSATACGAHYVTRGADLYAGGHYVEAAEVFERTEPRLDASSPNERARYGLYRGATLLALGDTRRAAEWLHYSRELARVEQRSLSEDEQILLVQKLYALDALPPEAPPSHGDDAVAATRPLPVSTVEEAPTPVEAQPFVR